MIVEIALLGIALIVVGLLLPKLAILVTIGIIALVIAAVLLLLVAVGHPVGGRRRWY